MEPMVLLTVYCLLIMLASLAGGWIPMLVRLTHKRMELAVSAIAGFMLGVSLLVMLPHAGEEVGSLRAIGLAALIGFLAMFFIERFFRYHHHEVPVADPAAAQDASCSHAHTHDHEHVHAHAPGSHAPGSHIHGSSSTPGSPGRHLTWGGAAVGLTLHSLLDGAALAAAVVAGHAGASGWAGLAVFLVIFCHRPFDSMTLVTLMSGGHWPRHIRHLVNGLFALAIPLGVALFFLGLGASEIQHQFIAYALAFSAGTFLCIASSDLLPELHFHAHDRVPLSLALALGLAIALALALVDRHEHERGRDPVSPAATAPVTDPAHDHSSPIRP